MGDPEDFFYHIFLLYSNFQAAVAAKRLVPKHQAGDAGPESQRVPGDAQRGAGGRLGVPEVPEPLPQPDPAPGLHHVLQQSQADLAVPGTQQVDHPPRQHLHGLQLPPHAGPQPQSHQSKLQGAVSLHSTVEGASPVTHLPSIGSQPTTTR